jgi:hypothetical protein
LKTNSIPENNHGYEDGENLRLIYEEKINE